MQQTSNWKKNLQKFQTNLDLLESHFALNLEIPMKQEDQSELLRLFEGVWLSSPSGNIAYAKVVKGQLLIPYSRSEESKLAGHYYNCRIEGKRLVCQFERFEPYASGLLFLKLGSNHTLKGGWWLNENLPESARQDISQISENLPKMVHCVWILTPKAKIPRWVKEYFEKDSSEN